MTKRDMMRNRAVQLARDGMTPERAITTAVWEWQTGPARAHDAEREIRFVLECRAAIELALDPRLTPIAPRAPGVAVDPPAPGWSVDGERLLPPPLDPATGFRPDGRVVRALMDAPRHKIGVILPRPFRDPRAILWAMRRRLAIAVPAAQRLRGAIARAEILAAKGWKVATR